MKKLLFVLLMGAACRPASPTVNGVELTCSWPKDGVSTCVGGGRTYRCVATPGGCAISECGAITVEQQ